MNSIFQTIRKIVPALIFVTIAGGCSAQTDQKPVAKDLSNEEARKLIASVPDLQIVDVRQNWEVEQGMIEGAVQMDISKPAFYEQIKSLEKDKPVLVYCASGGRSKSAQEILVENGFKEVYNLKDGYSGWIQEE